ncbi:unnamed protein product [Camellia sinensis]
MQLKGNTLSLSLSLIVVAAAAVVTIFSQILSLDGHILAHILAATSIGVISATAFHYCHRQKPQKQLEDQTIVPLLDRNESGRVAKLERFSNHVGFEDGSECPQLCKLAYEYLKKSKECESTIYEYFADEPNVDELHVKLVEEFDRCILAYFAFHWSQASLMISPILEDNKPEDMQVMERSLQITTIGGDGVVGGGGGGLLVKKKGRPRKYESDGNLRLPSISSPPPGFSFSPPFPSSSEYSSSKRGRGRPLDSVVDEVLTRRKETEWFIEGDFDAYVERIRKPYVWGGELELLMASYLLNGMSGFYGLPLSRSQSDSARTSPIGDPIEDKVIVSELRNASNRRSNGAPIDQEMSKEVESKHNPPSVVAKLMGPDTLPWQQSDSAAQRSHSRDYARSHSGIPLAYWQQEHGLDMQMQCEIHQCPAHNEYKDKGRYNENTNEKKMALVRII